MKLTLIRGLPGSGKSTFATRNFKGILHLENDMFHMIDGEYKFDLDRQYKSVDWCLDTAKRALSYGMDVVVSNTFTKREFIEPYRRLADEVGAEFNVYRMTGDHGSVHNVPEDVIERMRSGFEDWNGEVTVVQDRIFN